MRQPEQWMGWTRELQNGNEGKVESANLIGQNRFNAKYNHEGTLRYPTEIVMLPPCTLVSFVVMTRDYRGNRAGRSATA